MLVVSYGCTGCNTKFRKRYDLKNPRALKEIREIGKDSDYGVMQGKGKWFMPKHCPVCGKVFLYRKEAIEGKQFDTGWYYEDGLKDIKFRINYNSLPEDLLRWFGYLNG